VILAGCKNEFFVNEYICGFGLGFGDLDLGCGEMLWISGEGVVFCWVDGLWKSGRGSKVWLSSGSDANMG
jgi:hypothetical protein